MGNETKDFTSLYSEHHQAVYASSLNATPHLSPACFFPGAATQVFLPTSSALDAGAAMPYSDSSFTSLFNDHLSPNMFSDDLDMRACGLSADSGPSTTSSAVGSPRSYYDNSASVPDWSIPHCLSVSPNIASHSDIYSTGEYSFSTGMDDYAHFHVPQSDKPFIDPTILHPQDHILAIPTPPLEAFLQMAQPPSATFAVSAVHSPTPKAESISPYPTGTPTCPQYNTPYVTPVASHETWSHTSRKSRDSFSGLSAEQVSDGETKEKCPDPTCGRRFKDLKAHMLTHQKERPEKCPIVTCEYNTKGFARKYDKNRHTLTHYKGTMICGFCPGSGSPAEKWFNRADVFKRHLTSVHGVEQNPPNSRKRPAGSSSARKLSTYAPDATGKCSTCMQTFGNAQDFYEHLDDCVLRIVQQEDPAEAVNASRLAEVENDKELQATLEKNQVFTAVHGDDDDDDEEEDMDDDEGYDNENDGSNGGSGSSLRGTSGEPCSKKIKTGPANGVQKSRGMTHSRGGVPFTGKPRSRRRRQDYPTSWGFDKGQMTMRKRVMTVFEGPRRLAKDDMMLSTNHEVRLKLSDSKFYVTDLDVQTLKRAEGFHSATLEEKGPWISDDPTAEQIKQMQIAI
ncbi:hypothetical protein SEPCBS119000_003613 [Sporothrix epigloea]|uniref:C2H2-type domain-containing protein n=1 Tax=Sporothrix epigloea TaxID=1892477 RepID=A0ABP0DRT2_9PEZI